MKFLCVCTVCAVSKGFHHHSANKLNPNKLTIQFRRNQTIACLQTTLVGP